MKKIIFGLMFWSFLSCVAQAKEISVLATIKPLQSIISNILGDKGQVALLLGRNDSPHNYNLRPSDAKKIQNAQIIFFISDDLETFMPKLIDSQSHKDKVFVDLIKSTKGLNLLQYRKSSFAELIEHHHDEHDGHHHHHANYDPHIWLDTNNTYMLAKHIAEVLSTYYPDDKLYFQANLEKFHNALKSLNIEIEKKIAAYKDYKFIVFHDAYQYFDKKYSLNYAGEIMLNVNISPSSKKLLKLRKVILEENIKCIFSEPQFVSKIIPMIIEGTDVKTGTLDAEWGADNSDNINNAYFTLMKNLAINMQQCFNK